jgi:hypothetical protein
MIAGSVTLRGSGTESDPEPAFNRRRHTVLGRQVEVDEGAARGVVIAVGRMAPPLHRVNTWMNRQEGGSTWPEDDDRQFAFGPALVGVEVGIGLDQARP